MKHTAKLCIPERVLEQHLVVLGKTGAGKSSALRHMVEHLLAQKKRVCIIDPKGDWWGLKSSADGKQPGFPVVGFGDFKDERGTDVAINEHSGRHVAELIASGNRPAIVGLRGWMPAAQGRFWIDFASTIFNSRGAGGLYLIIDEMQNFAPKERAGFGQENMALHWTKRLLSEGRGLGLSIFCGSQRPQSVHNGVLTQCETLVAMRLTHPNDIAAVELWLSGTRDKAKRQEILSSISELARGEAWVWSPEIGFGPVRLKFPMFTTFDSFAPPQQQAKISDAGWADVDLAEVNTRMVKVVEEAKANDPRELRAKIAKLEKDLANSARPAAAAPAPAAKVEIRTVERLVLPKTTSDRLQAAVELAERKLGQVKIALDAAVAQMKAAPAPLPMPPTRLLQSGSRTPHPIKKYPESLPARPFEDEADRIRALRAPAGLPPIGKCERAILQVLSQFETAGVVIDKLALLAGYSVSGSFKNSLTALRKIGAIVGENTATMWITPHGSSYGPFEPLPMGAKLRDYWLNHPQFGKCERAILAALMARGPQSIDELAEASGYDVSGSFKNALTTLRKAGVMIGKNTEQMSASEELSR